MVLNQKVSFMFKFIRGSKILRATSMRQKGCVDHSLHVLYFNSYTVYCSMFVYNLVLGGRGSPEATCRTSSH